MQHRRTVIVALSSLCITACGADGGVPESDSQRPRLATVRHTFTLRSGQFVECIDRDTQPGLWKPEGGYALIAEPPSPDHARPRAASDHVSLVDGAERCPEGTVPRVQMSDERRDVARRLPYILPTISGHDHVVVGQESTSAQGCTSTMRYIYPTVEFEQDDFSLTQTWFSTGSKYGVSVNNQAGCPSTSICTKGVDCFQTLEAGLQVYEPLWGDLNPHLFVYSTNDGYDTGCYANTGCTGDPWVQYDSSIPVGMGFPEPEFAYPEMTLEWLYTGQSGDWWLAVDNTWIGYYPGSWFAVPAGHATSMSNGYATIFQAGGEVAGVTGDTVQMGDGTAGTTSWLPHGPPAWHRALDYWPAEMGPYYAMSINEGPIQTNQSAFDYGSSSSYEPGYDFVSSSSSGLADPSTWNNWGVYFYYGGSGALASHPTTCE